MISNAQKYGKKEQEKQFTSMLKLFNPSLPDRLLIKKMYVWLLLPFR